MYSLRNTRGPSRPCKQNAVFVAFALIAVGLCLVPSQAQAKYGGGAGTQNSPYLIQTAEQMNEIGLSPGDWSRHFRLTADIDMSDLGDADYNIVGSATAGFSGVFDGNDHEISNLSLTTTHQLYTGLFGVVGGEVRNLGLAGPVVVAQGSRVGALIGQLDHGTVVSCHARSASVSGNDDIGALVGRNVGRIFSSHSTGNVSGNANVGGLVGLLSDGSVNTSYSKADVTGNRDVGGLVGKTGNERAAVRNCFATGSASGDRYIGGLVGHIERGAAERCFSAGSVSGNQDVGGLTGNVRALGMVLHCFWDTEASGRPTSGGGTGKTTAEMKTINTYLAVNWDFVQTWTICEGLNYPVLLQQIPITDFLCPDGVEFIDFAYFAARWHRQGCTPANGNCEGADVDG
ncbi:MAG: GLUG motif-containing protein, partial [Planctomycetota bacterium]